MSSILMDASKQWASRPGDERYTSLTDMQAFFTTQREQSRAMAFPSRKIRVIPSDDNEGLTIADGSAGDSATQFAPTHWAFGQLAQRAEAPAGYLRTLASPLAADCINYGLHVKRDVEDVGLLLQKNGSNIARAVTGPNYGRIWNSDIVKQLIAKFGDGITGRFRVPGEFGVKVDVTKANTTLYAGDRDMFVFLADEVNRIEVPGRRNGEPGQMARGFFVWNSEVGSATFGIKTFLFDYVCMNRIVWGAMDVKCLTIRHTASAPTRWADELVPALQDYANSSAANVVQAIEKAKQARIGKTSEDVVDFLAKRFSKRLATQFTEIHMAEEGRPIETLWDAATAVTAKARSVQWQDERVAMEEQGGALIDLAK